MTTDFLKNKIGKTVEVNFRGTGDANYAYGLIVGLEQDFLILQHESEKDAKKYSCETYVRIDEIRALSFWESLG